ncbi:MAG TPA: PEP-CTERM-box response regulator transcription factor [Candidatus Didemnitutus sp.]|nr:PEP-CTERM-box response regulator transcription factor [Candidatus Didemnitutus sp.]
MKPKLLIVDDDEEIRTQMRWALDNEYEVLMAGDRPSAIQAFRGARPPVVLLDLGLPPQPGTPVEGLAALAELLAIDPLAKIVIVSGQSEKTAAMQAVGAGAYDFLNKPVEIPELKLLLKRCYHLYQLEREYRDLQHRVSTESFEGLLGTSTGMQTVFESVRKVATTDAPVLILGESGTGKEMVARAIHMRSGRRDGPFVAINCSAIPESLMESELFGHEKGSFTGAHMQRKGRIETSAGGTLFLDEIGDVPLLLQVKLLRFLQEQRLERVGGRQEIQVDTRVIAATNVDLKKALKDGSFREDLYYRLAVVQILMPPLRERDGDILLLARSFLQQFAAQNGKSDLAFTEDANRGLQRHDWPGNVRELQNRVKRAVIMSNGRRLNLQDLELTKPGAPRVGASLKEARDGLETEMIRSALRKHGGKISAAAVELGISRPTLYEMMDRLGVQKPE